MTDTKPTSVCKHGRVSGCVVCAEIDAATAELRRELAAIKSQPVPVEPECPSPEHTQHIQFEGCDCVVMSPEEYESLWNAHKALLSALQVAQQELEVQMVGWSDCEEKLTKAEADHKAAEQNVSDLMAEVAQTGSLLMKAEAELAALRLELARLDGEIPYGN